VPVDQKQTTEFENVTADDVADAAGVSRWTVARAFKKDAPISEKSRRKVLKVAEELGYAPDLLASSLASDRSNLVALLVDDFSNPHKLLVLERLTRVMQREGWGTMLFNTSDQSETHSALLAASQRRVDVAVLIGSRFDEAILHTALGARKLKKLVIFARASQRPNTLSICCDDDAAIREMSAYLLGKGYKRPIFLAGPNTQSAKLIRKETFLDIWQAERDYTPEVVHVPQYNYSLAYNAVFETLSRLGPANCPDLMFCENDVLAIGAMDAIRHGLGLSVPGNIAVVGFDDIESASSPAYNLTTYRQPITAMADALAEMLKSGSEPAGNLLFEGEFIVRETA
jgi:DNA-binding LacI/PurR family transcriptional regulator